MSDASAAADAKAAESGRNFVQTWADSLAQVVGQITGTPEPCVVARTAPADLTPPAADDLWALVTSSGSLRGEMFLRLSPPAALRLAQTFMGETPAPEAQLAPDHREAVMELLRQISGVVTSAAKAGWGEIQLRLESAPAAPSWPPAETLWLQAGEEGPARRVLETGLSAALVADLRSSRNESASAEAPPTSAQPQDYGRAFGSVSGIGALDLLMDVQLAVSMRFGSRRLRLSEVLELSPGAVVELDRRVLEPVDLLLDGRLVAHGEVVVIDGNYGLRVTDVFPVAPQPGRNG